MTVEQYPLIYSNFIFAKTNEFEHINNFSKYTFEVKLSFVIV